MRYIAYSLVLLLLFMSSCLGSSGDKQTFGGQLGVAQLAPEKAFLLENGSLIYTSATDTMTLREGDCSILNYKADPGAAQTADGKKGYQVDLLTYQPVAVYPLAEVLTDTTGILPFEQFVTFSLRRSAFFANRFFLFTEHSRYVTGQRNKIELTYNPDQEPITDKSGNRYYELYLRADLEEAVNDSLGSRYTLPIAFDLKKFVADKGVIEKSAGKDSLKFVLFHPRNFNSDTTACVWTFSEIYGIPLLNEPTN